MTCFNASLAAKREALVTRARIVQSIRAFFVGGGFLEVETPVLIPAPAPEVNIDAPRSGGGYLQTSPELAMKRLLAAGYGNVFQLCRCFRSEERGRRHLPEFAMLEWYRSNADYNALMTDARGLLNHVATELGLDESVEVFGRKIALAQPWEELTVEEAFERYAGMSAGEAIEKGVFDLLMVERVEPNLGLSSPCILRDYPAPLASLARLKPGNPKVGERFELYLNGLELANGYSELTDPDEQRARFTDEILARRAAGKEVYPMPERFLAELPAMPPAAGIALGLDRLVMIFTGACSIDEVVAFTPEEL